MKRSIKDSEESLFFRRTQSSFPRPLSTESTIRFSRETASNYGRLLPIINRQPNYQAVNPFPAVVNNQTKTISARVTSGCLPNSNRSEMGRFLPGSLGQFMPPIVQCGPRWFSRRNAANSGVNYLIPRMTQRFQESRRSFALSRPWFRPRFISNTGRKRTKPLSNAMIRQWCMLPESKTSPNDFTFSIVSYNVLSDNLLYENKFLYEECTEDVLRWDYRRENLLTELLNYNADILCLQEVDAAHYRGWFEPKLRQAGYSGVYNQRSGTKPDGCVIFYRSAKFTLVKKKLVKYYTARVPVLDKDNVGIVVLLQPRLSKPHSVSDARMLCVANTHLLFNKKRGDIKLAQLAYLFAEVDDLARLDSDDRNDVYCPVIFCGDLNSLPYSPLHYFLINGQLDYGCRSPSVISGQLSPSEASTGYHGKRKICTPLLPWHFGVTMECRWRHQQVAKGGGPLGISEYSNADGKGIVIKERGQESDVQCSASGLNSQMTKQDTRTANDRTDHEKTRAESVRTDHVKILTENETRADHAQSRTENERTEIGQMRTGDERIDHTQTRVEKDRTVLGLVTLENERTDPGQTGVKNERKDRGEIKVENNRVDYRLTGAKDETTDHAQTIVENDRTDLAQTRAENERKDHGQMRVANERTDYEQMKAKDERTDNATTRVKNERTDHIKMNEEMQRKEHENSCVLALPFHFVSVYKHRFEDGTAEVTTCHSKACCNVDYIFYTVGVRDSRISPGGRNCVQKGTLTLLGRLNLLRNTDFDVIKRLPNQQFSSDHLSLQALFKLT